VASGRHERQLILFGIAAFFGGGLLLWLLFELRGVLLLLYIGLLLAIGMNPAVQWIEHQPLGKHRPLPRWAAVLLLYLALAVVVAVVFAVIVPPIAAQAKSLGQHMPEYLDKAQTFLVSRGWISAESNWKDLFKNQQGPGIAVGVFGAVKGVIGAVAKIITMLVLVYYVLADARGLQRRFLRLIPHEYRDQAARLIADVATKVGAWLSGQLFLCLVIGTAVSVSLWALGIPFYYILGIIAGIGEAVPVLGPIVTAIPAILVAATVSWKMALLVALLFWGIQSVENNFLVPRVMQRQVGLRTVTVLVALLCGSTLFGFFGALLAVPTAAIIQVVAQEFLESSESSKSSKSP